MELKQQNAAPTRKVMAGTLAGALVTLLVAFFSDQVPQLAEPGVGEALVTLISALISYFVPPGVNDGIVQTSP
ncbi:MAG: hypothetical protein AAF590_07595 [Pseudomonadota bacterium]